jgi:hypothetical protein
MLEHPEQTSLCGRWTVSVPLPSYNGRVKQGSLGKSAANMYSSWRWNAPDPIERPKRCGTDGIVHERRPL